MLAAPTHVDWLQPPGTSGVIGMMACPGAGSHLGGDESALERDLAALAAAGTRLLVSLLPDDELQMLGLARVGQLAAARGIEWLQLPVGDMEAPGEAFEHRWVELAPRLQAVLDDGGRLALHCFAGLGRTGTVVARLLIDRGLAPPDAVRLVRAARPGAIQSYQQMRWVLELAAR